MSSFSQIAELCQLPSLLASLPPPCRCASNTFIMSTTLALCWLLPLPVAFYTSQFFALPSTPLPILLVLSLAYSLTFTATLLLPLDITTPIPEPTSIAASWNATYWITFVLSWIVLPM